MALGNIPLHIAMHKEPHKFCSKKKYFFLLLLSIICISEQFPVVLGNFSWAYITIFISCAHHREGMRYASYGILNDLPTRLITTVAIMHMKIQCSFTSPTFQSKSKITTANSWQWTHWYSIDHILFTSACFNFLKIQFVFYCLHTYFTDKQ